MRHTRLVIGATLACLLSPISGELSAVSQQPPTVSNSFHFPDPGEPLSGHRHDVRQRQLRKLRAGKLRPDRKTDLHHKTAEEAHRFLEADLLAAHRAGEVCVLVVHGKGVHSAQGEAVLKRALAGWLTSGRIAAIVLAFSPAQPRDGGSGACYVALRDVAA